MNGSRHACRSTKDKCASCEWPDGGDLGAGTVDYLSCKVIRVAMVRYFRCLDYAPGEHRQLKGDAMV